MKCVAQCITALVAIFVASSATLSSLNVNPSGQAATRLGQIERLDARLDKLVPKNAQLEKLCDGYAWVEGPVWNRKENYLLFSNIPANAIIKWKAGDGCGQYMNPSGYTGAAKFEGREPGSNGLTYDAAGRLVLCEHGDRRVARLEKNGTKTTLADRYDGHRLNSPNDLAFKSNGDLYFTDPAYGLPKTFDDPQRELPFCGVYRVAKDGKVTLLTKGLQAPNGIAFSPDEKRLYVSDSAQGVWMVYDVKADGTLTAGRVFYDAKAWTKTRKGAPDGLKIDRQGNLFASGPEGIYVFAPDGTHLGTIETGVPTANCAWGDDGSTLYITANTAVYRIRLTTKGAGF
jgi:gluconolactonase